MTEKDENTSSGSIENLLPTTNEEEMKNNYENLLKQKEEEFDGIKKNYDGLEEESKNKQEEIVEPEYNAVS